MRATGGKHTFASSVRDAHPIVIAIVETPFDPNAVAPAFVPFLYAFLVVWGLVDCFFGYRIFRMTLAMVVALVGAVLGAWAGFELGNQSAVWSLGGLIAGAIGGAILAAFFYKVGVASLAAFWTFALVSPYLTGLGDVAFWTVSVLACGLAAVLAIYLVSTLIMAMTAYGGALRVVYGVWFFLGGPALLEVLHSPEGDFEWIEGRILPLVIILVLGTFGFFVQSWSHYRRK